MFKLNKVRFDRYELTTGVLWFTLDAAWLYDWLWIAYVSSVSVVITATLAIRYTERSISDKASALAILLWVSMSAFWVTGDMNKIPWAMIAAKVCTAGVPVCLLTAIAAGSTGRSTIESIKKFRRVRF